MRCRNYFSTILMLVLLAFFLPSVVLADDGVENWQAGIGDGLEWRIENRGGDDDKALVIRLLEGRKSAVMKNFRKSSQLPWGKDITSVHLPEGLVRVGSYAFYKCDKIKGTLYIPATVESLGESSFRFARITAIQFAPQSALKVIEDECFRSCYFITGELTIPKNVAYIGNYAFYHAGFDMDVRNEGPMYLNFEEGSRLQSIGMSAFGECRCLTGTLMIPENVTEIRDYAFYATGIINVQWMKRSSDGVPCVLSLAAFKGCTDLTGTFRVPAYVSAIGKRAFQNTGITSFIFEGSAPAIVEEDCFKDTVATALYPAAYGTTYEGKKENYGGTITWIPYGVTISFHTQTPDLVNPSDMNTGEDGTLDTLPDLKRKGHTFEGWYRDAQCSGDAVTVNTLFDSDTTLYAKWTKPQHTVTFDAQGGNVFPSSTQLNKQGQPEMLPVPTKAGYDFDGWYCKVNGIERAVSKATVFDSSATIYAKWIKEVTVKPESPNRRPYRPSRAVIETKETDLDKTGKNSVRTIIFFIGQATYQLNEKQVTMDAAPFIYNDRTMLPVRYVGEALGMHVHYDESSRTAVLTGIHRRISIHIDQADMQVNGTAVPLAVKPVNVHGRIYLPIGLMADALGMTRDNPLSGSDITYDERAHSVYITGTAEKFFADARR